MKIAFAALTASLLIAPAVHAQSLHETHQLVWAPTGKTPVAHYRMRDHAACPTAQTHHQAGKSALPVANRCVAAKAPAQAVATK